MLLGVAEIELEYRRERQAAGIRVAKKRGAYRGRSNGTTKAKPERGKGLSVPEIASAMQVSERTVFRYLAGTRSGVSGNWAGEAQRLVSERHTPWRGRCP